MCAKCIINLGEGLHFCGCLHIINTVSLLNLVPTSTHFDDAGDVEIMAGSILFEDNYDLCFVDTILWSDVLTNRISNMSFHFSPGREPVKCNYHSLCDFCFNSYFY